MLKTYKAIINNDRLKWLDDCPQNSDNKKDMLVHVTVIDEDIPESIQSKGNLVDFFRQSPLYQSGIDLGRDRDDFGREVEL